MLTAKIIGTGSYVPDNIVKNSEFEKMVETSSEWIETRTGISQRRIGTGMENWEMGLIAARRALESAGSSVLDIGLIVGTTVTPDYFYPGLSNIIQNKLGAVNATCFDVGAACNGFVVGLDIVWQFIRSGSKKKVLMVSSEALTKTVDFTDRSTCVLFGDGAGAVLFEAAESGGIINTYTMSEPDEDGALRCRALIPKNPFVSEDAKVLFGDITDKFLRMNGPYTYKFATRVIPASILKVIEGTGLTLDDIKYIVPHQANLRIINTAAAHLGIEPGKMYVNIEKYGNTSSATMPIALDEMSRAGLLEHGDRIIFVGFGAGLNYGAALLEW